ncbi:NPL4 family, putative zinc binding region-domain-containing protein [Naematelia encephala]|uniref:Nuclear protein localization protein 4 n=1 Tax=Naematelia encephala TaxID=71784 RepID=A0A1Y2AKZ1_9TREE|nr:NPL4 family, putative zinc binding region-domain-containing protein [Naematelia encephala]
MLLRIRSPAGTSRITVEPSTSGEKLAELMLATIPASDPKPDPATLTLSNQPGSSGEQVPFAALVGRTVSDMGFSHGDLLFLSYKTISADPSSHPTTDASSSHPLPSQPDPAHPHTHTDPPLPNTIPLTDLSKVEEPEVDVYWQARDGKIERKRDPTFCRHGEKGMCDYCMPVEPYDAKYQAEQQIKHLSFNAYLRKLLSSRPPSASSSATASTVPPLSPLSLSVMTPCPTGSHPPFPAGICSTCQPSAQTLTSQSYRMVDHVEFATPAIIEGLLGAWRRTGTQRFAFLIGRYDKYEKVPMGVKSVIEATWEPRQEGELDGLTVETPWEDEERVSEIAGWCEKGLGVVGMIYTDLTPYAVFLFVIPSKYLTAIQGTRRYHKTAIQAPRAIIHCLVPRDAPLCCISDITSSAHKGVTDRPLLEPLCDVLFDWYGDRRYRCHCLAGVRACRGYGQSRDR